jgi:hypothetical protein
MGVDTALEQISAALVMMGSIQVDDLVPVLFVCTMVG